MKQATLKKSSFTLPSSEVLLVDRLKKSLHLKSNTQVVRQALHELRSKVERQELRRQFEEASQMVQKANREEMRELDRLSDEGLE